MKKMDLKWKKYSEKELIRVIGGKNVMRDGYAISDLSQYFISILKKWR